MTIVKFADSEKSVCYGIETAEGNIVCGCCGNVFNKDEVKVLARKFNSDLEPTLSEIMEG